MFRDYADWWTSLRSYCLDCAMRWDAITCITHTDVCLFSTLTAGPILMFKLASQHFYGLLHNSYTVNNFVSVATLMPYDAIRRYFSVPRYQWLRLCRFLAKAISVTNCIDVRFRFNSDNIKSTMIRFSGNNFTGPLPYYLSWWRPTLGR